MKKMKRYSDIISWKDTLEFFYEKYNEKFPVQLLNHKPSKWVIYRTKEYEKLIDERLYVNQRQRMIDEIVFDIDVDPMNFLKWDFFGKGPKIATKVAYQISDKLCRDNIPHYFHLTGGSGGHLHAFIDDLKLMKNKLDRQNLKKRLIRHYAYGFITKTKDRPFHVCNNGSSDGLLIALENSRSRKGRLKTLVFSRDESCFKESSRLNHKVWKDFKKHKADLKNYKPQEFKSNGEPSCIKYLLYEDFRNLNEGRMRALFILVTYFKYKGLSDEDIFFKIKDWHHLTLNSYYKITDSTIRSTIRSNKGLYMCPYIKGLLEELNMLKLCRGCKGYSK